MITTVHEACPVAGSIPVCVGAVPTTGVTGWSSYDPEGIEHGGLPTYGWHMAPEGLATKRQLLAMELRAGGQPVAAQVLWMRYGKEAVAFLYRVDLAKPKRNTTLAQLHAIEKALASRRICPLCKDDAGYTIPTSLGCCVDCHHELAGGLHDGIEKGRAA